MTTFSNEPPTSQDVQLPGGLPEDPGRHGSIPGNDPRSAGSAVFAAMVFAVHAILAIGCVAATIIFIPRCEKYFKDYNLKLPWPTQIVLALTRWLYTYWYIILVFLLPVLAVDFAVLYLLHRSRRTRWWSYILAFAIVFLTLLFSACMGLGLLAPLPSFWL